MSNPVPSALALTNIAPGAPILSADHRTNYAAIQAAVNALEAALSGGVAGQVLQAASTSAVQWGPTYTTYVPAWAAAGVAPALGNGTLTGRYVQIGKYVHGYLTLTAGTTTTFGTGNYNFTLPVAAGASNPVFALIGTAYAVDTGVASYAGMPRLLGGLTAVEVVTLASPAANWTQIAPFTFANGDQIIIYFAYEAA